MGIVILYLIALIMGAVGGVVHQLHDSEQKNETKAIIRGAVMGAIAGLLTFAISPIKEMNTVIVSAFIVGWFGDSVILNIIRRNAPAK